MRTFKSEMQRQARVEGDIGDGRRQWRQQLGSLAAWDRIARSEQETVVLSQNIQAVGLFRERREMSEENKRRKKKKTVRLNNKDLGPKKKKDLGRV